MELIKEYKQLTNVDIIEQKRIWDERGKGYYGEYLLFCELYKGITGNCKILMNLNIPADSASTTEIDLLMIHETGIYVFEIKHYKGTIYGKDSDQYWTQYFRTAKNSVFKNPIEQNGYHVRALKKLLPDLPIRSFIVFTNDECDLKINNNNNEIDVCLLHNVIGSLAKRITSAPGIISMSKIDEIFDKLLKYSKAQELITIDGKEATFCSWVTPTIDMLNDKKQEAEWEKTKWEAETKKVKQKGRNCILASIGFFVACIVASIFIISAFKSGYEFAIQRNNNELKEFKQNFLHVDEIGNEYINELNSYVTVSNVSLTPMYNNAVSFTARIAIYNDTYGIALTENSRYIVMTNDGKVFEYNVFGEHLSYSRIGNMIGTGIRSYGDLAKAQFYGVGNADNISYIKITDIELFKLDAKRTVVKDKLEIELYER